MLRVENLNLSYRKGKQILYDVSINVKQGEIVGLIGMNGAGKSTLMRAIAGVVPYESGNIFVSGTNTLALSINQRREISFLNASHNLYGEMTVYDNLNIMKNFYNADEKKMTHAVDLLKCSSMLDTKVSELSSGMRQRASIASATIGDFKLFLFDEPTNALDIETKKYILDYIRYLSNKDNGILITSHNIKDIEELCDRVYILRNGRIVKEATIESILSESAEKNRMWNITIPKKTDCNMILSSYSDVTYSLEFDENNIKLIVDQDIKQQVLKHLILDGIEIVSVNSLVDNLEDAVLEIIGDKV